MLRDNVTRERPAIMFRLTFLMIHPIARTSFSIQREADFHSEQANSLTLLLFCHLSLDQNQLKAQSLSIASYKRTPDVEGKENFKMIAFHVIDGPLTQYPLASYEHKIGGEGSWVVIKNR